VTVVDAVRDLYRGHWGEPWREAVFTTAEYEMEIFKWGRELFAQREGVRVDHGHTVPAGSPLWPGTDMTTLLVVRPVGEILPALTLADGVHVEFLQVIPIFESERRFKVAQGVDALLERWERAGMPFWDPRRKAEPAV
jgi:hypothetical protein